jgi:hypothetical protein
MTRGMCCPTSDGAACAIVCSEAFVKSHKLENQAIEMVAQSMTTDSPRLFSDRSAIEVRIASGDPYAFFASVLTDDTGLAAHRRRHD